ncbi:hypothetical protein AB4084_34755, partial [Lysobacter sp. 2RAB21]
MSMRGSCNVGGAVFIFALAAWSFFDAAFAGFFAAAACLGGAVFVADFFATDFFVVVLVEAAFVDAAFAAPVNPDFRCAMAASHAEDGLLCA